MGGGQESLKKEKLLTQWFEFECKLQANVTVEQHVADRLRGTRRMKPWNHILLDRCMTEPLNMAVISSAPSILDTTDHDRHTHRPTVQDSSSMWFSCAEDGTAASASSVFSFSFWLYSQERNLHVLEWLSTRIHSFVLCVCVCVFTGFARVELSFGFFAVMPASTSAASFWAPCHWQLIFRQSCDAVFS